MLRHTSSYAEVIFKADTEPALKQLVKTLMEVRGKLGYKSSRHNANPAERAVQSVRRLGNTLLETVRARTLLELPSSHPIFCWAYRHAAWLLNRFAVTEEGRTPFEIINNRPYTSKLAPFGAIVYGQPLPKQVKHKGVPPFQKGVYLGRMHDSDLCLLANSGGVFQCRSIRRCADEWQSVWHWTMKGTPWDWHEDVQVKQMKPIQMQRIPELAPLQDGEKPKPDGEGPIATSQTERPTGINVPVPDSSGSSSSTSKLTSEAGSEPVTPELKPMSDAVAGKLLHTPPHDSSLEPMAKSAKSSPERAVGSSFGGQAEPSVDLRMVQISDNEFVEVDEEEQDELQPELPEYEDGTPDPPQLSEEELEKVDQEAMRTEFNRLVAGQKMVEIQEHETDNLSYLGTRFVFDWRWREQKWVRRARLVAKEFAHLDPMKPFLYAPASVQCGVKILPALMLSSQGQLCLHSCDVKDAYLQVRQEKPTYVSVQVDGNPYLCKLGYCLPGQRIGAKAWYLHLKSVLEKLELKPYGPTPTVFIRDTVDADGSRRPPFAVSTHVDDFQVLATEQDGQRLFELLESEGLVVEKQGPLQVGSTGECSFLKRSDSMQEDGMVVTMSKKYIESLKSLLEVPENRFKKVPTSTAYEKMPKDETPLDAEKARKYRTAVGILIYISPERADVQASVRLLGSWVTKPRWDGAQAFVAVSFLYMCVRATFACVRSWMFSSSTWR